MTKVLWGNDAVPVYVRTPDWTDFDTDLAGNPGLEALWWPDAKHPSGKGHLGRVSYLYVPFNGWVKRERIIPRG